MLLFIKYKIKTVAGCPCSLLKRVPLLSFQFCVKLGLLVRLCCEEGGLSLLYSYRVWTLSRSIEGSLCPCLSLWPAFSYEGANHPLPLFSVKGSLVTVEEEKLSCRC